MSPVSVAQPQFETPAATARAKVQLWAVACIGSVMFAAAGHLLIKMGLLRVGPTLLHAGLAARLFAYFTQPMVLAGLAVYGFGTMMWVFAVARKEISFLYPLTALNYGLLALAGHVLLGETISAGRWLGITVVMIGVVLMQWSDQGRGNERR